MKKVLPFLIMFLLIISCKKQSTQIINDSIVLKQGNNNTETSDDFLNVFKNIEAKGLHIYPPTFDDGGKIIKTPFEGIPIDIKRYKFFEDKSIFFNEDAVEKGLSNIYAVGKFEMNDKFIGLIIRQRSQYDETLIEIVLWDKNKKKIISSLTLADTFGDENWFFDKESWIKDFRYNKELKIISRKKDKISKENCFKVNCDSIETDSFRLSQFKTNKFISKIIKVADLENYKLKVLK